MSSYRFTNSTTLGGKYVANWPQGFNPQKYRWKRWSNATGYDMFIPENTSSERSTVHSYLQNVSGVSRTVGWFGSADGRTIVTSVQKSANSFYCHFGVPGTAGDAEQYGYATANACPGGTTDRFGSVYGNSLESLSESQDNPYYNTAASSNTATNFYLSYRYTNSSRGSENVWDYYILRCTDPTFPWRQYQIPLPQPAQAGRGGLLCAPIVRRTYQPANAAPGRGLAPVPGRKLAPGPGREPVSGPGRELEPGRAQRSPVDRCAGR